MVEQLHYGRQCHEIVNLLIESILDKSNLIKLALDKSKILTGMMSN